MFADTARIIVKSGNGGNGLVSFHREKYVAAGGPDGGDGGRGGDVIFTVDPQMTTLYDFRHKKVYKAGNGEDGRAKKCFGKNGESLYIKVPAGTLVKDGETGKIIADLKKSGDEFIAARGGKGGFGNTHFATPTRQVPKFAKPGQKTNERELILELKLLADVGLVGFPNVGKSTLLSVVSSARPKIANYHFTTLEPNLGVVNAGEAGNFVMADIPGIIEGANTGIGLGHEFLRHIERTRLLLHVVDVSGIEDRNSVEDFDIICQEMEKFNPELSKKPQIVVGNKTDIAADENAVNEFETEMKNRGFEVYLISAASHKGTEELMKIVAGKLKEIPVPEFDVEEDNFESIKELGDNFHVEKRGDEYYVEGELVLKIIESTNFEDYESLQFFQNALRSNGIVKALEDAGIEEGDTVKMYDIEFDFVY